jgi:hypothetical protein
MARMYEFGVLISGLSSVIRDHGTPSHAFRIRRMGWKGNNTCSNN